MNTAPTVETDPRATDREGNPSSLTVSISEASALLGVSVATIRRLIQRRMLKVLPGLRHKRVVRKSLYEFASGEHEE